MTAAAITIISLFSLTALFGVAYYGYQTARTNYLDNYASDLMLEAKVEEMNEETDPWDELDYAKYGIGQFQNDVAENAVSATKVQATNAG